MHDTTPRRAAALVAALAGLAAPAAVAAPEGHPVILQWFEQRWLDMEHKIPDYFLSGYGALWLPSPFRASDATSPGYDIFNRFDLGGPGNSTAYGTEEQFRAVVDEFHRAGGLVYLETILNHNSGRSGDLGFQQAGGWPGFWMGPIDSPFKGPTNNWGDFHNGIASGYYQSEDPGGPRYDLHRGDLVALVDIAQESNNQYIRQPVVAGNPQNIPAGSVYNQPDANNARFYPDRDLPGQMVSNPGTFRTPGVINLTFYPFNEPNPMAGDAVAENATGMLMRWLQWMVFEFKIDGFRLDAAKHTPPWFWDQYFDSAVYQIRKAPDGTMTTPYSFVEAVDGNSTIFNNYVRKPNNSNRAGDTWGNRDALDLSGAGALRNLVNAGGFGFWGDVIGAHLDNVDNYNDGTVGVNHVTSHDNGSTGNGSSMPSVPTKRQQGFFAHAYLLFRPGPAIVYHNARGISRSFGFFPREGSPLALGLDPDPDGNGAIESGSATPNATLTNLVHTANEVARGQFFPLSTGGDVLVYERSTPTTGQNYPNGYSANVLIGASDSYGQGFATVNVTTTFPQGTRLHEMTGNAADPIVDPTSAISEVLTVGSGGQVSIRVPHNTSSAGEHNRGFVVYAPALPTVDVQLTNIAGTIPADPASIPPARRRLAEVPYIQSDTFSINVTTTQTDPSDANTDDAALFRFGQGFVDLNGNATVDVTSGEFAGWEQFLTLNQPLFGSGNANGHYAQTIDASNLPEGYNYLSVATFRHRPAGNAPLFDEARKVVYIDRLDPEAEWSNQVGSVGTNSILIQATGTDKTVETVYVLLDVPSGTDPRTLVNASNLASRRDRSLFERTLTGLTHGYHTVSIVAGEDSGRLGVTEYTFFADICVGDTNADGVLNSSDFLEYLNQWSSHDPEADLNPPGGDGVWDSSDFLVYLNFYALGC
ncbi:MAG: GC-type dockerin domain-anchored protein [Phycisphaerales bacterium]|jgi:hypothetical protein|nr:GC-type dockerin domain-anchored protein [Phycisphaerales bacterium]